MSSRNQDGEFNAGNTRFAFLLLGLAALVVFAWLTWHPKSPLRPYKQYQVHFQEVGTLRQGSAVQLLGVQRGEVHGISLREDGVLVDIRIDRGIQLPIDSRFRIINTGLLGQREVEVRPGVSSEYLTSQSMIKGSYDHGSTRLAFMANSLFESLDSLLLTSLEVWDSTLGNPEIQRRVQQTLHNAQASANSLDRNSSAWLDSLNLLKNELGEIAKQANETIKVMQMSGDSLLIGLDTLRADLEKLQDHAINSQKTMVLLLDRVQGNPSNPGSANLLLHNQKLHAKARETLQSAKETLQQVRRNGLDMNADLF